MLHYEGLKVEKFKNAGMMHILQKLWANVETRQKVAGEVKVKHTQLCSQSWMRHCLRITTPD